MKSILMKFFNKVLFLFIYRYIRYKNCLKNWIKGKIMSSTKDKSVPIPSFDSTVNALLEKYYNNLDYIQHQHSDPYNILSTSSQTSSPPYYTKHINICSGGNSNSTVPPLGSMMSSSTNYTNYTGATYRADAIPSFNELILSVKSLDSILGTRFFESVDFQMIIEEMREKIIEAETGKIKQKLLK